MTMLTKMDSLWNGIGNNLNTTVSASFACTETDPSDHCPVWVRG